MAPIEGRVDTKKIKVPAGKINDELLDRLCLRIEGRENGGVVSFKQDRGYATDLETTGKPLVSIHGETIDVYLDAKQKLEIVGQQEKVIFKGTRVKSKKK